MRFGFLIVIVLLFVQSCQKTRPNQDTPLTGQQEIVPNQDDASSIVSDKGRAIWQKPAVVIQKLGNISNKTVCDLGAGGGYFTFKLALKSEKVIAVDIDSTALQYIDSLKTSLPSPFRDRIETRLATPDDPKLKQGEVDIILIINTIAYIDNLKTYLLKLKQSLKPDGQVMIVDYKMKRMAIQAPEVKFRIYENILEDLLYECAYSEVLVDDTSLDYQYIITAKL
ncbi:MAG: methyltransferase domain-containing protein [Saprospiraceae bacterium]